MRWPHKFFEEKKFFEDQPICLSAKKHYTVLPHLFSFSFSLYQLFLYFNSYPCVLVAVTIGGDANRGATTSNPLSRSPRRAVLNYSKICSLDAASSCAASA